MCSSINLGIDIVLRKILFNLQTFYILIMIKNLTHSANACLIKFYSLSQLSIFLYLLLHFFLQYLDSSLSTL